MQTIFKNHSIEGLTNITIQYLSPNTNKCELEAIYFEYEIFPKIIPMVLEGFKAATSPMNSFILLLQIFLFIEIF